MKRNRVTDQLLKECPKCGDLAKSGDKDCSGCGAPLMKLTWTPEEVISETQATQIDEENKRIAQEFADNSPEIVSMVFPGAEKPKVEEETAEDVKKRVMRFYGMYAIGSIIGTMLFYAFNKDNALEFILIVAGIFVAITGYVVYRYIKYRETMKAALSSNKTYKALIVSVGDKIMQYGKQFRTLNAVADIDGRTVCVRVNVNYVPDDMCETFYPIGKEITLYGRGEYLAAVLES